MTAIESVFFDIDGTLVDSNDAHARSWVETFAESGRAVAFDRIRPLIGMGGDKLLASLDLGFSAGSDTGKALTARRKAIFLERYVSSVRPFAGAHELVKALKSAGLRCIVASSASPQELTPLLQAADLVDAFDHAIAPDEIAMTKPDPDVIVAALNWSDTAPANALMIGDTSYDIEAAHRSNVRCVALRCGGSSDAALADAEAIFDSPQALVTALRTSTLPELLARVVAAKP